MQIWVKQYIICIEERACASAASKHLISDARLANVCTIFAKYHRQENINEILIIFKINTLL
jgi:hypothetical protein